MLKAAVIISVLALGVTQYFRWQPDPEIPKLPDVYWGPGAPKSKPDLSIRPFKIDVAQQVIDDLNARLERVRPVVPPLEKSGWTYGMSGTFLPKILTYWRTEYKWKERQALLNKYPQFLTNIQGLDIHFYHVKPTLPKDRTVRVLPLLLVHGWPGSVVEFQKIIPLLTTPRKDKDYVFEVIAPSLPGYGFSDAAAKPGLGPSQMSVMLKNLMTRLGIKKFYTQGGDWGSLITSNIAAFYPESVFGSHLNMCYIDMGSTYIWTLLGSIFPSLVVDAEHASKVYPLKEKWSRLMEESGYMHIQATKPDTVGVGLTDSPAGLAAYILEKFSTWTNPEYRFREDGGLVEKFSMDELLDNLMMYWTTNTITTSMRIYAEQFSSANRNSGNDKVPIKTPVACANFPHEIAYTPRKLLSDKYRNLVQFNDLPRGGHFAAFEEPELLANDFWSFVDKVEEQALQKKKEEKMKNEAKKKVKTEA